MLGLGLSKLVYFFYEMMRSSALFKKKHGYPQNLVTVTYLGFKIYDVQSYILSSAIAR